MKIKSLSSQPILLIFFAFIVKIYLSFLPSFTIDMGTWISWGQRVLALGPAHFYSDSVWTEYTPGFLYWLWLGAGAGLLGELWVKLLVVVADIATGLLIFHLVGKKDKKLGLLSFFLYVFNPVVIFDGSVWGQIDGILTFFVFSSFTALVGYKKAFLSGVLLGLGILIKPQALAIAPLLMLYLAKEKSFRGILNMFLGVFVGILPAIPFFPGNFVQGLVNLILKMDIFYALTSLFAFNFWSLVGMWQSDATTLLSLSYRAWGIILYLISTVSIVSYYLLKKQKNVGYLIGAMFLFAFFLFPTRVHERYIFPVFAFLLTSASLKKSRDLLAIYFFVSLGAFLNIYYAYAYYTDNFLRSKLLLDLIQTLIPFIAISFLASFVLLFILRNTSLLPKLTFAKFSSYVEDASPIKEKWKTPKVIFWAIILFIFASRIFLLWYRNIFYFEEVYHAFTAVEIVKGNPQAWEFWATPPEGLAYEWTHPPFAKLAMSASMLLFGQNQVGWRLPGAIFGVLSGYLLYSLTRQIFKRELPAFITLLLYLLEGLPLVLSRIGMNDIYFLSFTLGTILFFLKDKYFLSALFLGLALSSKWTSFFVIPILVVAWIFYKRRFDWQFIFFLILPPLLYFASYTIFFTSGHNLKEWWDTQQQMWWYHTGLKATHPYSSPWWSWPIMAKPVWLFVEDHAKNVSNIYLSGNPILFWGGLSAIFTSVIFLIKKFNKNLLFALVCYLGLFLPWSISPRIMFLYHYLPATPFMLMLLAWLLARFWDTNKKVLVYVYFLLAAVAFVLYYPLWTGLPLPKFWSTFLI